MIVDRVVRDLRTALSNVIYALSNNLKAADNFGPDGTAGQVLTSNGQSRPPSFQDISAGGFDAYTKAEINALINSINDQLKALTNRMTAAEAAIVALTPASTYDFWIPAAWFEPFSDLYAFSRGNNLLMTSDLTTTLIATAGFSLPLGDTILSWTVYGKRVATADTCRATLSTRTTTGSGTQIGSQLEVPATGGNDNVSATVNHVVANDSMFSIEINLFNGTNLGDARLYAVKLVVQRG